MVLPRGLDSPGSLVHGSRDEEVVQRVHKTIISIVDLPETDNTHSVLHFTGSNEM